MNPAQAIEILDKVCGNVSMGRQDHLNVMQAVSILRAELNELEKHRKDAKDAKKAKEAKED